uniref:EGF-like domain-containing protein n=1 Tax=Knipowitschia caucasica TaxID=637954 RepID=A0AAV2MM82_KNICA
MSGGICPVVARGGSLHRVRCCGCLSILARGGSFRCAPCCCGGHAGGGLPCVPGGYRTGNRSAHHATIYSATVCSSRDCDENAQCSSQGSKVTCVCKTDYEGNGRVCVPKNPCNQNNGDCPVNSTVCAFSGANKSTCQCMAGMRPVGGSAQFGCELVSACLKDSCHPSASCRTGLDGHDRCECSSEQIGDGWRCYGNLMEQLLELDRTGDHRGNLTETIALFEKGCSLLLNHDGPFTAFIPLLRTPLTGVNEEEVCKNHLILGEHLYKDLEGKDFSLYGGGRLRSKGNKVNTQDTWK